MKKIISVLVIATVLLSICFSGCAYTVFSYASSRLYNIGSTAVSDIYELDVSWLAGEVIIEQATDNSAEIKISEKSNTAIGDEHTMHWYSDGTCLYIKCAKSGVNTNNIPEKTLTITLPRDLSFKKITIDTVSANVKMSNAVFAEYKTTTVSGNIKINNSTFDQKLKLETTSGNIDVADSSTYELDAKTTSGLESFSFINTPQKIDAKTVSGDIKLFIPQNSAFELDFDTFSGNFSNGFTNLKEDGNDYLCGAGTADYNIDTTSGSFYLQPINNIK